MMTKSFALDVEKWDLELDDLGNIAITTNPYAVAQDVACACKTELGEMQYNRLLGIPYFSQVFERQVGIQFVQEKLKQEALRLPYVQDADVTILPTQNREIKGVITIIDTNHEQAIVNIIP